ncbi:hypothetical protein FB45DRAFT_940063 [Roridomyces roridus]|uniref:F-box domain-containing protein n=1 Tax=Roridomyces roridus TaxID=1738132 RepID=A0AAD7FAG3_9AGAR|nr:hypothetical protein FB45DRAFT_940063 [Roridomyces roridus]
MVLTRRGHRARMLITKWLPNEILTEIIQHAPRADQATLCRTSKSIQALTLPILNRMVVLEHTKDHMESVIDAFLLSMIDNPGRATATRSLKLVSHRTPFKFSKSTNDLLFRAMELFKSLDHLSLQVAMNHWTLVARLERLTFPLLSKCSINIPDHKARVKIVAQFLSRHPTITHLRLWPAQGVSHPISPSDWAAPMLPNLQHYRGTPALVPAFSTRSLKSMVASLDPPDYAVLRPLANPELPFAMSVVTYSDVHGQDLMPKTLRSLSEHMPFVTQLRIQRWDRGAKMETHVTDSVEIHLRLLTRLEHFELNFAYGYATRHVDRFVIDAESDRQALQAFADACPTMKACRLVDRSWRKADGRWDEYPTKEFQKELGFYELDFMD